MATTDSKRAVGFRRPVHVGTRLVTGEGEKAIVAIPLVKGEVLERCAIDAFGITKDAETNVDQPPIFEWIGIVVPFDWAGADDLTTADLDAMVTTAFAPTSGEYVGGEANPGGNTSWGSVGWGRRQQIFRRTVIGNPIPVGQDALNNADARFSDRFRTVIKKDVEARQDSIVIFGTRTARTDAQTDFGVAELDSSRGTNDFMRGYLQPVALGDLSAGQAKVAEVLYGGDNYIEADSFKETDRRMYMITRPAIRRSPEIMGRW